MTMTEECRNKIIDALNVDRAYELAAIIQYMGHYYEGSALESEAVASIFKETSTEEMSHAEMLAERITYLGGVPLQKPAGVKRGGDLMSMIEDDLAAENESVERYRKHIKLCSDLGDDSTKRLLEEILEQEKAHVEKWRLLLSSKSAPGALRVNTGFYHMT